MSEAEASYDFGKKKRRAKPASKEEKKVEEPVPVEPVDPVETPHEAEDDEDVDEKLLDANFGSPLDKDDTTEFVDDSKPVEAGSLGSTVEKKKEFVLDIPPDRDYSYKELASRIFSLIARPEERTVYRMQPPVVYREGTKKTVWVNFPAICKIMNRQPEHVMSYLLAEVGSTGSIDGNGRLVLRGRFQPKHVENLLRSYIGEYVKCHTCKGPETVLKKENRLLFVVCEKCGSTRSVVAVKTGFQAESRATRRAARAGTT